MDIELGGIIDAVDRAGIGSQSLVLFSGAVGRVMPAPGPPLQGPPLPSLRGHLLDPGVLNVPLLMRAPGLEMEAGRYRQVTRSMDIFPTLLELAGIEPPDAAGFSGVSLARALVGELGRPALVARSHTPVALSAPSEDPVASNPAIDPQRETGLGQIALTAEGFVYKYGESIDGDADFGAFDRVGDFFETVDLVDVYNPLQRRMLVEIKAYRAKLMTDCQNRGMCSSGTLPDVETLDIQDLPIEEKLDQMASPG